MPFKKNRKRKIKRLLLFLLWTPQLLVLLVTSVAVDLVVMHGYAFLASRAQRWLATARARRAQNRVFGGVLMAMGASLLLVKRAA